MSIFPKRGVFCKPYPKMQTMIDLRDMKNFKHKENFTFGDASNLKALDIPNIVAKRSRKKHVDTDDRPIEIGKAEPKVSRKRQTTDS